MLYRVAADFADRTFLKRTVAEARRMAQGIQADPLEVEANIKRAEKRLKNLVDMAADSGDKSILARIRGLESMLRELSEQKAAWMERKALKEKLLAIDEGDLRRVLGATALKLRGDDPHVLEMIGYSDKEKLAPDELRRVLTSLVERVVLDPKTRNFAIRYRLPVPGVKVASPRGFEPLLPP